MLQRRLPLFKEYINNNVLIISLLAGVSTDSIRKLLQKDVPIIRAMPNTSAAILKSATAISPSKHATAEHIRTATSLFETIGLVSVVEEEDMHAVTALSGSGPAYIYYVVEAMEEAAKKIGLKEDVAKSLILQTMIGAAEMLKASDKHPSILRKEITSPGGTTEAGIEVLQEHKFQQALISCITQATKRSHNLGKTLEQLTKKNRKRSSSLFELLFSIITLSYCSSQKSLLAGDDQSALLQVHLLLFHEVLLASFVRF